jgi:uncharacterized protein (DUF2267 family)
MSDPITRNFDASMQKTFQWIDDCGQALLADDRQTAYHALRGVLHALRDRLMPDEACDLAAELPSMLRGMYFEGWRPSNKPLKMNRQEFLEQVKSEVCQISWDLDPEHCVSAVFGVLQKHIAAGEISDIRGTMPKQFQELWPAA